MNRYILLLLLFAIVAACAGVPEPPLDRSWLCGERLPAAPGRVFGAPPNATPYFELRGQGDDLLVTNTSLGSGITPILYTGEAPARLAWEVRAELLHEGIDGGWGLEFAYRDGQAYRAMIYASGRFCVDRAHGEYPEFIHCVTRLPTIRTGEEENRLGLEVDGPRVRIRVNGHLALSFEDERIRTGKIALAVAGAGAAVLFREGELRDLDR